jgi:hypothetical protein
MLMTLTVLVLKLLLKQKNPKDLLSKEKYCENTRDRRVPLKTDKKQINKKDNDK